ncbi:MAG: hypothetical protein PVF85_13000 [Anaerolineales bacterium]|jgi:hypothetical protein
MATVKKLESSERDQIARLINPRVASDAQAAYYALEHPSERVSLFGYFPQEGILSGFVAIAQTGFDLFRPLIVPFTGTDDSLIQLLEGALPENRPHLIYLPIEQESVLDDDDRFVLEKLQLSSLLRLDPRGFEPILNILVLEDENSEGWPRFEIKARGGGFAAAGLNWKSKFAAEMYIESDEEGRRRGFSKSVLSTLIDRLLAENLLVLFRVTDDDYGSFEDAFDLGFVPTGVRSVLAQVVMDSREKEVQGR